MTSLIYGFGVTNRTLLPNEITLDHIKAIINFVGDTPYNRKALLIDIDSGTFISIYNLALSRGPRLDLSSNDGSWYMYYARVYLLETHEECPMSHYEEFMVEQMLKGTVADPAFRRADQPSQPTSPCNAQLQEIYQLLLTIHQQLKAKP